MANISQVRSVYLLIPPFSISTDEQDCSFIIAISISNDILLACHHTDKYQMRVI